MDAKLPRTARLVRMALPDHVCPWGLRARHLLRSNGFSFDEQLLTSREEVEAFKAANGVKTTPQVWIAGQRVGGHDDLRQWLGLKMHDPKAISYRPVIALFGMAAAMALAVSMATMGTPFTLHDVKVGGRTVTLFAVVENLFDKDPPPVPSNGTSFGVSPVYDLLGRSYRMGLRFKI